MTDPMDPPDLPDIESLEPEEWLSRIDELHDELLEALVEVLDTRERARDAVDPLEGLFEAYHPPRTGETDRETLVSVEIDGGALVFEREDSSKSSIRLEPNDAGHWRANHPPGEEDEAEDHEAIAHRILQLVPWWSERAFVDRVGSPDDVSR